MLVERVPDTVFGPSVCRLDKEGGPRMPRMRGPAPGLGLAAAPLLTLRLQPSLHHTTHHHFLLDIGLLLPLCLRPCLDAFIASNGSWDYTFKLTTIFNPFHPFNPSQSAPARPNPSSRIDPFKPTDLPDRQVHRKRRTWVLALQ